MLPSWPLNKAPPLLAPPPTPSTLLYRLPASERKAGTEDLCERSTSIQLSSSSSFVLSRWTPGRRPTNGSLCSLYSWDLFSSFLPIPPPPPPPPLQQRMTTPFRTSGTFSVRRVRTSSRTTRRRVPSGRRASSKGLGFGSARGLRIPALDTLKGSPAFS